jgi:hypothetical protein
MPRFLRLSPQTAKTFGQFRVHVVHKRPEIPANTAIPAFAFSVTSRKQVKVANTGSIPVSATNSFISNTCEIHVQGWSCNEAQKDVAQGWNPNRIVKVSPLPDHRRHGVWIERSDIARFRM